jgi:hypothetical protein
MKPVKVNYIQREFIKLSVDLRSALPAAEAHLAEGHCWRIKLR